MNTYENLRLITQYSRHLVILCEPNGMMQDSIAGRMETIDCLVLKSPSKNIAERFQCYAWQLFTEIQQLLTTKQEGKILLQLVIRNWPEHQLFAGLAGLLMTAHLENPNLIGQLITIAPNEDAEDIVAKLKTNAQTPLDQKIDYHNGDRRIGGWKEILISNDEVLIPWKEKGKYLITGGLGGLGLIFSKEIAQQICDGTIILAGRSPLNETKQQLMQSLEKLCIKSNTHIEYRQADICDSQSVTNLIEDINQNFGYLDGIIHAAGVIYDNFIIKKTSQELEKVLAPKVMGSVNLDEATKDQPLDFFFFCSSLAGAIGNVGQADYACANAFMDCYAKYRNQLVQSHQRQGRSLSINWPLWQEGGMRVDEAIEKMMAQSIGLVAMPTSAGIRALYKAFASNQDQVMILEGDVAKLKQFFLNLPEKTVRSQGSDSQTVLDDRQLKQKTLDQLKSLFAEITKLPLNKIDPEEPLENYGIDSIIISQLNHKLTERLGSVSQTLFYQFQNLADLADHLATNYMDGCRKWIDWNTSIAIPDLKVESVKTQPVLIPNIATKQPIAIIGLSGRYPKAKTIAEFWQKLQNGEYCIEEIPKQRWDWQHHYHPDRNQAVKLGKSYSKWGGFLEDFDRFDPIFFNMTPREAANIDPQERLFLEESWKALEDAGYSPSHISADLRQRIGVFAGITKQGFNLYRTEFENSDRNAIFPATSYASLVNRVSYFLNLQGPSFPIDTMCSSSLVAIHEACEYIRSGKGDMAIVGGVNLYAHPSSYLELSLGKFVSSSSICAAFEKDGDGFVPGEGVGVVILKSYDRAIKDRDRIYALIRGSAVNHDGKTNGYKTPNPEPKAAVIRQALQDSGIDARSISYIEAAAQGSEMGDAIEASALTEVFRDRYHVEGAYRIGSVKPNIGHCESASGMSQLTKVILSLHNKTLVPTLRSRELSPSIDFQRLPFELQQDLSEWKPVSVDGVEVPRRAGIMNIGAGGVNACVIVEEYAVNVEPVSESQEPVLFVLSAKNEERLEQYVQDWLIYLKNHQNLNLRSIAYTLQVGRESMTCRLAFVVKQSEEIEKYLNRWLETRELGEVGFYGDLTQAKIKNPEAVAARVKEGDADNALAVAELWVQGNTIPWDEWHNERILDRINGLPTYPFVRRTCSIVPHENEFSEAECNLENNLNLEPSGEENKVVEFYTRMSQECDEEFQEEYLTFGAFPQRIPGFSMTRVAMNAAKYPEELEMIKEKQREVRQVLFCRENFAKIHTVLDIGCGHGTDVIQIAALYPHIQTHGFTITEFQAVLGNRRIENMNLGSRAHIYHKDSSKDKFPDRCDIILGVEVTFHIRDKDALFRKMADALSENGKILLMDYIGNLRGSIVDPNVEISIPTQQQWIDLLSKHNLIIDEIIDVSREISNYLYDPEHAEHTKHLPKVSQDSYRNYANQAIALEKGWITYNLLKLRKDTQRSEQERRDYNTRKIANQTPYSHALDEMLRIGHIPYPPMGGLKKTELSVNKSKEISPPTLNENVPNLEKIKSILVNIFVNILGFAAQELKSIERLQLGELGITSINAVELLEAINTEFDLYLPSSIIFECHNLEDLAQYIQVELGRKPIRSWNYNLLVTAEKYAAFIEEKIPVINNNTNNDIAIIGISCRCAGAKDQEQFWQVVSQGKNCIADLNKPEWLDYIASHCSETFPIRYGMMPDLDYFDSLFFHISPREAKAMDATQRILLEECYRALEDAGYKPSSLKKKAVGTYIGAMGSASLGKGFSHFDMLGSETSILSARIAYFLDLKGPALTINTACSSSLVAIDVASKALKNGEINLAIAGGVTFYQHPGTFIAMHNAGMLSKTGQCRPFDNNADGIVVGDGVGVVILKRLQEAQRDGDAIYGIIRGCGINQDGQTSSLTVPSFVSQSELESSVYQKANINLEDLQYIEAHGTATKLGDPIEIHALNKSFQSFTAKRKFCAISSLKANVGHTTAAAGVLGVIKVLLSMKHQQIPPSINFDRGNQHIDFDNSPVYVNTQLKPWPLNAQGSRLAAVSSFGFSGTNAHLVLEHYIPRSPTEINVFRPGVFLLSAESESTLQHYAYNVKRYLEDNPGIQFERFLYTFQVGREAFTYRLALIANNQQTLIQQLKQWLENREKSTENEKLVSRNNQEETALIQKLISDRKVEQLAQLWEQGTSVDWSVFYQSGLFHRLAGLPTYPFTGEYFGSDREQEVEQLPTVSSSSSETLICYPHWQEKAVTQTVESLEYDLHLVLLSGMDHISVVEMQPEMPSVEFVHLASAHTLPNNTTLEKIYQDHFTKIFEIIQEILVSKNRGKTFIQCVVPQQTEKQCLSAISGILKTAQLENPKVFGQVIEVSADETETSLLKKLNENCQCLEDKQIRYYLGQRKVLAWKELVISNRTYQTPWREGGVYLITGGAGGLGLIFAEEIATKTQSSTIILTGRSDLSLEKQKSLFHQLQKLGARVEYWQADISNKNDVDLLMQRITKEYGSLNGILHCAGIVRDNFIIKKTSAEFQSVLAPKVAGVINLDAASKDLNLDFLVLFSSISGTMGNRGQADYAIANAFMDAFSSYRNDLVKAGQRWGQTLSINWPLWEAGGMQLDAHHKAAMKQSVGLETINTVQGVQALFKGLASGPSQILVAGGHLPTLKKWLLREPSTEKTSDRSKINLKGNNQEKSLTQVEKQQLQEKTLIQLKGLLGESFGLAPSRIKASDAFEHYGIDSVIIIQLNQELAKVFPEISQTLFFEYQTSQALVAYLVDEYPQECMTWTGLKNKKAIAKSPLPETTISKSKVLNVVNSQVTEAIAIIGVSGHFSQADTLQAYWQNLLAGIDCVGEIPSSRWSLEDFFVEDADEAIAQRKSYSKWGSFLEGFADFDPLFFGIPPRDVLSIDPQERLFLQASWEALEDAGYTRDTVRDIYQQQVGVFAGITKTGFDLYGPELWKRGEQVFPHTSFSSVANRTSYFLNLQGPSLSIDTMCSSSLIAIHEACEHLRRQNCQLAFAGGVNLYLHPSTYVQMCALRMLSKDGKCKAFGKGGNGFVPGEGVGVVLLKPLSAAIRDRDNIYAIIRASHVNHDGKTNGYTVPNPKAQADLIRQTLNKAGVDARSISYIEAHGTGTELGDPIEITGLTQAFNKETADTGFCAIGSAKSNLGHLEAASGIAGLCKIILQLKHRQIVPSLHTEDLNPNIAFDKTPFVVQQTLSEWKRPIVEINGEVKEYPRRAGISSFGAGGSNAHLIIEEYAEEDVFEYVNEDIHQPVAIVLSAKNTEQLIKMADNLRHFLIAQTEAKLLRLEDIAYTLQTGREAMEERLAMIVSSLDELENKLKSFVEGQEDIPLLYRGHLQQDRDLLADFASEEEFSTIIDEWIASKRINKLLNLWVRGFTIDWQKFYDNRNPQRISLPTYPFAKEFYWFDLPGLAQSSFDRQPNTTQDSATSRKIHYLQKYWVLDESRFDRSQYQKQLTGKVAILSNQETRLLATLLAEEFPNSQIVEFNSIKSQLEQSDTDWSEYIGCIDLLGCCKGEITEDSLDWILWFQCLIEKGSRTNLKLLGITQGLESFQNDEVNLSGASRVGLYRMLQSEYSFVQSRHVDIEPRLKTAALAEQIASEFLLNDDNCEVCCRDRKRYVSCLTERVLEAPKTQSTELQFAEEEVLLITGGTGGLGLLCAQHFAQHYAVKRLVLTGRETLPPKTEWATPQNDKVQQKIRAIQALEAQGVKVEVLSLNLSDRAAVQESLRQITTNFGPIAGLLHCAGIVDSENPAFVRKSIADIAKVLEPKVVGLRSLLKQCQQQPLKFAVLFSSVSAIIPSLASGQSDYAMANTYMDYVAEATGGIVVSIQWSSWQEAGMGAANTPAYKQTGLLHQTNQEGLQLLDNILTSKMGPVVLPAVVHSASWNPQQLMKHQNRQINSTQTLIQNQQMPALAEPLTQSNISNKFTLDNLINLFSQELGIAKQKLDLDKSFADYGLDSIWLAQLTSKINQQLIEPIAPSSLYEYSSLKSLASWLTSEQASALKNTIIHQKIEPKNSEHTTQISPPLEKSQPHISGITSPKSSSPKPLEIAVVGMSCQFPGAKNLDEYWTLLSEGKSSICPVSGDRWSSPTPFYAGLIDNISDFDPAFFLIPPEDAKVIDPQAFLVLEECLNLFYHAGYTLEEIKGSATGVFLGARSQHFVDAADLYQAKNPIVSAQNYLATHVSQFFDLKGPSLVIDTACSSALVGMNFAIQSLLSGEIDSAVVGGVSLLVNENAHRIFQQRNLLNQGSEFHIFDRRASGITLGEGVGLVLLKTLQQAQHDRDRIYAIIKGLAINNDGRTAGPATPNIKALKEVMQRALAQSAKQPQDIIHIEANGSGSEVTDLLELKAIEAVYRSENKTPCSLGSIKPNIGHPLCAEGIAGLIKLVCMLNHQQQVPFLSGQMPLTHYNIDTSPFYFCRQSSAWMETSPLVFALNCFADGGTNAHIIIGSWLQEESGKQRQAITPPQLKRVNVRGNSFVPETVIEEKVAQDTKEASHNPWWGDST